MKKITYKQVFVKKTYKTKKIDNIDKEKSKEKLIKAIINDYSNNKNKYFSKSDSSIHLDFQIDNKNIFIEILQDGNLWTYTTIDNIPIDIIKSIRKEMGCSETDFFIDYWLGFEYFVFIKTDELLFKFIMGLLNLK